LKTIGLIGGMSWESTAVYYRLLNEMTRERLGGLHSAPLLLWSFDFAEIEYLQAIGDWDTCASRLSGAGRALKAAGANLLVICTNTMHKVADAVQRNSGLPVLHIADATAAAVSRAGLTQPLLLGTRYTMEQAFYRERMREHFGIEAMVPPPAEREVVNDIIYHELCRGIVNEDSRSRYLQIIDEARHSGADGVILGCTEIGLLISSRDVELPVLDSTLIHAEYAMEYALNE
jgi:aspartate racemase